jgi:hypothetical protein
VPPGNQAANGIRESNNRIRRKNMFTILIIILVLFLVGALPTWPHSRKWGYYPSGGLGLVLLILIILLLMGRI